MCLNCFNFKLIKTDMNNSMKKFNRMAFRFILVLLSPVVLTIITMVILAVIVASIRFTMGASFAETYNIVMGLPGLYMLFGAIFFLGTIGYIANEVEHSNPIS